MNNTPNNCYSVSRLNAEIRSLLESSFPLIWVEGEISNLVTPRSGHSYFSLKDEQAQVRCALFRGKRQLLRFQPADGDKVLARARISLYEARGEFQLIIEHMEPAGEGLLQQQFEQLKARLAAEGLFDTERKRPLPPFPRCVGIITSATGAALQDILQILERRFPAMEIIVYPSSVQGAAAPLELIRALRAADTQQHCDLLILTRGGGSLEDLSAFNDEALARTIASLSTPVISAVGHEIDFTIADFVADLRAPTPSAAAELATPDQAQLLQRLEQFRQQLKTSLQNRLAKHETTLRHLQHRLQQAHPHTLLLQRQQRLDDLALRLEQHCLSILERAAHKLLELNQRLQANSPQQRLNLSAQRLQHLDQRLERAMAGYQQSLQQRLAATAQALHAFSPLQTLERGYSLTLDTNSGQLIQHASQVSVGQTIESRLAQGRLVSRVEKVLDG